MSPWKYGTRNVTTFGGQYARAVDHSQPSTPLRSETLPSSDHGRSTTAPAAAPNTAATPRPHGARPTGHPPEHRKRSVNQTADVGRLREAAERLLREDEAERRHEQRALRSPRVLVRAARAIGQQH